MMAASDPTDLAPVNVPVPLAVVAARYARLWLPTDAANDLTVTLTIDGDGRAHQVRCSRTREIVQSLPLATLPGRTWAKCCSRTVQAAPAVHAVGLAGRTTHDLDTLEHRLRTGDAGLGDLATAMRNIARIRGHGTDLADLGHAAEELHRRVSALQRRHDDLRYHAVEAFTAAQLLDQSPTDHSPQDRYLSMVANGVGWARRQAQLAYLDDPDTWQRQLHEQTTLTLARPTVALITPTDQLRRIDQVLLHTTTVAFPSVQLETVTVTWLPEPIASSLTATTPHVSVRCPELRSAEQARAEHRQVELAMRLRGDPYDLSDRLETARLLLADTLALEA